ncbi:hypothetical protein M513_11140 [Trichuris suis]|uniref:Leucine zipper tumor suppressor 3 n=1 Tax=Trichuris suis TaxID=68888 RepID=A0A085LSL7_9BILA|nr:hypothetical protein M513_11140 [Trichuris suis]
MLAKRSNALVRFELGDFYYFPGDGINNTEGVRPREMAPVHDRMNDRQAMWLWQSSGNLAMPQTIVTHREAVANKPYCSMNNLASNSGHGIGKRMERIASLDPIFGEDEELNGSSINGFTKMPQRQHLPSVRGSAWDICREGRYDQRKSPSIEQPNSKGAVKKQSAFVRGLCDLASVERLKMWKAKLPLVSRNRHSSKASATATTTFAAVVAAGAHSRSRRFGQQSPLAMAEEGNYDVPVTPNRFDQEGDSKSAAAPISTGTRMVNAYLYYQQRKAAAGQLAPQDRRTNEHSETVANGNPSSQQLANRVYRKGQQQFRDVMEQRRPRYFASAYAQNSAYDNPENLMASRKLRSINEIESKRSGSSSHHSNAMVLPPPVKIVACGGVPVNPDQPRLVKPSAFRPVQPSGWQTAKASLVEVTEDSDKRKPVGVTPPFPVGGSKSIHQKHFPSGATKVTVGGDCLGESTSLSNEGEVDQLNGGSSSSGLHSQRSHQSNSDKQSIQAEEYVVTQSSSLPQSRGPSSERGSLSSPVKMSRQEKFDQIAIVNGTSSSSYGCQAAVGTEAQTNPGQTRQSTSRSSRNSSGIQVTPSPSDSGVAEIEATLREKDAEIANLRSTMEHNEQVIIRVYQEKEERWQEKLRDWGSRLQASVRNEQRLLSQIHCMREEMGEYQTQINNLFAEKQGLQKKIRQMENEVFELRAQLSNRTKQWSVCKNCSSVFVPQTHQQQNQELCPSNSTDAVRSELEALRLEICEIRHSLQGQAA